MNLKQEKKNGLPETNGAEESRSCSSSSLRAREASLYAANVILWKKKTVRQRYPRKGSQTGKTSLAGRGTTQRLKGARTRP